MAEVEEATRQPWSISGGHEPADIDPALALRLAVVGPSTVYRVGFSRPGVTMGFGAFDIRQVREIIDENRDVHPDAVISVTEITVSASCKDIDPESLETR